MLTVIYEDKDILVVKKPAGVESQSARSLVPDMVSEIRNYLMKNIHKLSPASSTAGAPYVGVIHRLDRPVSGLMVYAKNRKAAAGLSKELQEGKIRKWYMAVLCGKPVDNHGGYVDYMCQDRKNNTSSIVDKSVEGAKKAELNYEVLEAVRREELGAEQEFSLVRIELLTGRHHQIRVQFSAHGTPLYGDRRYGKTEYGTGRDALALCACRLAFAHPVTGKWMEFQTEPKGGAFDWF